MSEAPPIRLTWSALTQPGSRKPGNDDALLVFASGPGGAEILAPSDSRPLRECDLVFAVSDGMGGGNAGDLASRSLLKRMTTVIPTTFRAAALGIYPDYLQHLADAIEDVHRHVNEVASHSPDHAGMAATLALGWFTPDNLYLANVGDSRLYRHRGGRLEQLSCDHSFAWREWKRGGISEFGFRTHPRRSALFEVVGAGHDSVTPHLASADFAPGDVFLLCTDGLIDGLWERHIDEMLAGSPPAPADPEQLSPALLARAIDNAGLDDTTLIVIAVCRPTEPSIP